jgi:hypothetical protein
MSDSITESLIALEKSAIALAEATRVSADAVLQAATACLAQRSAIQQRVAALEAQLEHLRTVGEVMEVTEGNVYRCPIIAMPEDYYPGDQVYVLRGAAALHAKDVP